MYTWKLWWPFIVVVVIEFSGFGILDIHLKWGMSCILILMWAVNHNHVTSYSEALQLRSSVFYCEHGLLPRVASPWVFSLCCGGLQHVADWLPIIDFVLVVIWCIAAGVDYVLDTVLGRDFSLQESCREFVARYRRRDSDKLALPMLTSACPGMLGFVQERLFPSHLISQISLLWMSWLREWL